MAESILNWREVCGSLYLQHFLFFRFNLFGKCSWNIILVLKMIDHSFKKRMVFA